MPFDPSPRKVDARPINVVRFGHLMEIVFLEQAFHGHQVAVVQDDLLDLCHRSLLFLFLLLLVSFLIAVFS
eukprot:CAMPEP_0197038616 /NCGR_PEP_ID=MMETSP1384-20130603/15531_1 /TAXON_ID=29189 /ORGANISM="Ammonia sp." /LENGTH=70 /DNA_ID=CAMNT_0042469073 /DNA_START=194 /DNA_END=402 /DNA_ORIENTATION=-